MFDKNGTSRILHPIFPDCRTRCQTSLCQITSADCQITTGQGLVFEDIKLWLTDSQGCKGDISFVMDSWSSPNHYAYVAVMAHFQIQGEPMVIVLDVVKVPEVRPWNR